MKTPWILKPIIRVCPFAGQHPRVGIYLLPAPFYEHFGTVARIRLYFWRWQLGVEFHYVELLRADY